MICPISIAKFTGVITLGLYTGISYSLSTLTLPSLSLLPSATTANRTLTQIQHTSTRQILTLASISSLSLVTAYTLASRRNKHPYLLWTALMSFIGGQGVEWFYNGFSRFGLGLGTKKSEVEGVGSERGYVEVERDSEHGVNGEKVEGEMKREGKTQLVRTALAAVGFAMGVVGIWGDGA